ncbi:MAG TPA: hypothetical protein VMF55_04370 [Solirubrobacterales bacterium]|nr:hypothetical protein [Solirubrobacterales bacterium]
MSRLPGHLSEPISADDVMEDRVLAPDSFIRNASGAAAPGQRSSIGRAATLSVGLAALIVAFLLASAASSRAAEVTITPGSFGTALSTNQAGAHPDLRTTFTLETLPNNEPLGGTPKDLHVEFPPGFIGAANATPTCPMAQVLSFSNPCPLGTAVGEFNATLYYFGLKFPLSGLVYNVAPDPGEPAALGFFALYPVRLDTGIRSETDYGLTTSSFDLTEGASLIGIDMTLWGVPADHNGPGGGKFDTAGREYGGPGTSPRRAFFTNPTQCGGGSLTSGLSMDTWQSPGVFASASYDMGPITGCNRLSFAPTIDVRPDTKAAGAPAGLSVDIDVPQNSDPSGLATPDVKGVTVALPDGMQLSPGSTDGSLGCTDEQIGLHTPGPATCPDASKIGNVEITTPLLDDPLKGTVFLGSQESSDPASGQMFRIFFQAEGSGVRVKLEGSVKVNPANGQITTTFAANPQLPFEHLELNFNGGPRAVLTTPDTCGTYRTQTEITSYAGGAPVDEAPSFVIDQNCDRSGFTPSLEAGTTNPIGGKYSPFTLTVQRQDGQQNLAAIGVTLPKGLLAKLAGVPLCGDGEAAAGTCGEASRIGSATVASGEGSAPIWVPQPGRPPTGVYLAGPYKGAPYSIVTKVPAQSGPFDLGTVVVRSALQVDPTTTQVSAVSDPLPQIVSGVPVYYRTVNLSIDRSDFIVNPTNCEPSQVTSSLTSAGGSKATPSDRFQVADCAALAFAPKLALAFKGGIRRTGHPALTATLTQPVGENSNIAGTTVILPKSSFIDQAHVRDTCTRVQFNEGKCPQSSILGTATAWSPLLDKPLTGPVYFRSNGGERRLPDMVADLNGQIHVILVGFIDSKKVGKETSLVRTRFASVPDAPVSKFELRLKGGKRGLIQNSADLCKVKPKAEVKMAGQNGKTHDFTAPIQISCGGNKSKGKKSSAH